MAYKVSLEVHQYTDQSAIGAYQQYNIAEANIWSPTHGLCYVVARPSPLAGEVLAGSLAVCFWLRCLCVQSLSNQGQKRSSVTFQSFLRHKSKLQRFALSLSFWVSWISSCLVSPRRKEDSQIGFSFAKGAVSGILKGLCFLSWSPMALSYRAYQPSISDCIWEAFQHSCVWVNDWSDQDLDWSCSELTRILSWRAQWVCRWSMGWPKSGL